MRLINDNNNNRKAVLATTSLADIKTILSIQEFTQILRTATPDEIEKIPLDLLPKVIPDELIEATSGRLRKILENIIFELNMHEVNVRMEIETKYAADVSSALFYFSDYFGKENFTRLNQELTELNLLYKTWQFDKDEQKRLALLPKITELNGIISLIRFETKSIIEAKQVLEANFTLAGDDKSRFAAEIKNLEYVIARNQKKMSQYYYLRLLIVGADMRHLSTKIKDSYDLLTIVQESIDEKNQYLDTLTSNTFLPRLSKKADPDLADKLRKEINDLLAQKKALEVPISETALIAWLDVVIDAALTTDNRPGSAGLLGRVRMTLFHLLQQYCEQQEASARDVAKNPFSQASPEDVIKFLLQSEQFILDYFKKKRIETASWMCDLAKSKVDMLDGIEKTLLKELKRNAKRNK